MKDVKKDDFSQATPELAKDSLASPEQLAQLQGHYQLQAAKINSEATINAAKIGARARYFHGAAALISAFGVFGAFAYKLYEENALIRQQTEQLKNEMTKQQSLLQELAQVYDKLAEEYLKAGKSKETEDSQQKAQAMHQRIKHP